jgi:hypothetical protein
MRGRSRDCRLKQERLSDNHGDQRCKKSRGPSMFRHSRSLQNHFAGRRVRNLLGGSGRMSVLAGGGTRTGHNVLLTSMQPCRMAVTGHCDNPSSTSEPPSGAAAPSISKCQNPRLPADKAGPGTRGRGFISSQERVPRGPPKGPIRRTSAVMHTSNEPGKSNGSNHAAGVRSLAMTRFVPRRGPRCTRPSTVHTQGRTWIDPLSRKGQCLDSEVCFDQWTRCNRTFLI